MASSQRNSDVCMCNEEDYASDTFALIWLDSQNQTPANRNKQKFFKEICSNFIACSSPDECAEFITMTKTKNPQCSVIIVISGRLSLENIPRFQDDSCILSFLIYCKEKGHYEHLKYPKLHAIHTEIDQLTDELSILINRTADTSGFSTLTNSIPTASHGPGIHERARSEHAFRDVKQDQTRLVWLNKIHYFLRTMSSNDDRAAKEELVRKLSEHCEQNREHEHLIQKFRDESMKENARNAVKWYTEAFHLYQCLNRACRTENISNVYSYRYIIKLIGQQLEAEHKQFLKAFRSDQQYPILRLYRGECVDNDFIDQMKKIEGGLISFNGFWSTSRCDKTAQRFIEKRHKHGLHDVLFVIQVDMSIRPSCTFADISHLSRFKKEQEVLFSIGSIFKVNSINFDRAANQYNISLSLLQDDEQVVNKYIEETYAYEDNVSNQSILFGKFLYDMAEYELALSYFLRIHESLSSDDEIIQAAFYNNLGVCYNALGKRTEAQQSYQRALERYERLKNDRGLGTVYHNLASSFCDEQKYKRAIDEANQALHYRHNHRLECAATLDLLGCIHLGQKNHEKATDSFEAALEMRKRHYGSHHAQHPDIGRSHENLGGLSFRMKRYREALEYYQKAAKIYEHSYFPSHPLMLRIHRCLQSVQEKLES